MRPTKKQDRVATLVEDIQRACEKYGLNMTLHDGGIGFVDQESQKIIAVWKPIFTLPEGVEV